MSDNLLLTIKDGLKILEMFMWLLDSYVLDYFTDCHWNKLPFSWRIVLDNVEPQELAGFLIENDFSKTQKRVWPLSLLALKKVSWYLSIPRKQINLDNFGDINEDSEAQFERDSTKLLYQCKSESQQTRSNECKVISRHISWQTPRETQCLRHPRLHHVFKKHVKPKKQHEISRMAQVTASIAQMENCQYVVDIGSGLGHLARLLAYGYGLRVCCLEAQENLSSQARKLDLELEISVSKIFKENSNKDVHRPVHLNMKLDSQLTASDFVEALKAAFAISDKNFKFGIVGLHPCGDLAPILMHLFAESSDAKFINIVGCCYMKLTTGIVSAFNGYPMSKFVSLRSHLLSYEAREIACHAIESYQQRLSEGQYEDLKVHCYRATMEKIIVKYWPHLRHTMIKSIKHTPDISFTDYITIAFTRLGLEVPQEDLASEETDLNLLQWKRVVIFYSLRLLLAPLVETILLLDRLLFLEELGISSNLIPLFDPSLSPRNSILIGRKS